MRKTLFLDTNIYLHYQDIKQIDWLDTVQADEVLIVVPPVIVRELNKTKDSGSRSPTRHRADKVIKQLLAYYKPDTEVELKPHVLLYFEGRDPPHDFFVKHYLSFGIQDDHIIASIMMRHQELPDENVVLVTSDGGLALIVKAGRHGISTKILPDQLRLRTQPDPREERIRELEQQLRELQLRVPQLRLAFEDGTDRIQFSLPAPVDLPRDKLDATLNKVRRRYPKMFGPSTVSAITMGLLRAGDIAVYNAKLDSFYEAYASYLQENTRYSNLKARTVKLAIRLVNDGTAPAHDIDLFLYFPDGLELLEEGDLPDAPVVPDPPLNPQTPLQKLAAPVMLNPALSLASRFNLPDVASARVPVNVSAPTITRTNGYEVRVNVRKVKHRTHGLLDPLYVVFDTFKSACPFHLDYDILTSNPPGEAKGQLHILIEKPEY